MPYYHDSTKRIVYSAPETPSVSNKNGIWTVFATIEITRADNYYNKDTGAYTYPFRDTPKDQYHEYRDSREDAIRHFKRSKYPNLPEISFDEYLKLSEIYEDEASNGGN